MSKKLSTFSARTASPPQTEESVAFRIVVQCMVIVGILATDVAGELQTSPWAIPLSIGGAVWSWQQRRRSNIGLKFLLAIGMVLAMLAFFNNLLSNLNDTRLVLAELLIQLQVLHSFDLPRRKDLGYSMTIGLILMAVAGTVSQTSQFSLFLALFLFFALPALILDYRSRLGFSSASKTQTLQSIAPKGFWLSPRRWSALFLVIVLIGLGVFAVMPRFPGYKLQSFPVSSPGSLEQKFQDDPGVVNPSFARDGRRNGNEGEGSSGGGDTQEDGVSNTLTQYYGFNSTIDQVNFGGTLEPQLVMRVRSQSPGFWRVLAFDQYTGTGWTLSQEDKTQSVQRPSYSFRFLLPSVLGNLRRDVPTRRIVQTYSILERLPNLLPVLSDAQYFYFPSEELAVDSEGGIRAPFELDEGVTYTAISRVPRRNRSLLQTAGKDYPEKIRDRYLQIPSEIVPDLQAAANQLLSQANEPITAPSEIALFLAQSLKQSYQIQSGIPAAAIGDGDLTQAFLSLKGGHPDHFPTVLTMMLRSLGIPARLAVGYQRGQFNPFTGFYLIRNTDAHAITEVYFPGQGWFTFDPIPGHELVPPGYEQNETFAVLTAFWRWVAGWLPSPIRNALAQVTRWLFGNAFKLIGWLWGIMTGSFFGVLLGLVLLIILGFASWLLTMALKNWWRARQLAQLPLMAQRYQQMLDALRLSGYGKRHSQTPREYAQSLQLDYPGAPGQAISDITEAYVAWHYGSRSPDIDAVENQWQQLQHHLKRLRSRKQNPPK
ncbi:MAG: transglutaminaseTgpA domain-containing protein [Cyanobacteria bacterium P01_H01_bin.15]